ncbi:YrdB family protein [Streptomyces bungoensis]|uniref:YrdB family protein n=1 Tax=Streptomyces bungoensis TaxID=285568 RepID=UPI003424CDDF
MQTAKAVNLGVIFLLELGVLAAAAYWGYTRLFTGAVLLALLAPGALAWLWALFGAPRARFPLHGPARAAFELVWFGTGVVALYAAGAHAWALVLALVCLTSKSLAHAWGQ